MEAVPRITVYSGPSWLYFIRPVGAVGPVKIGITLKPHDRLETHQKHSPLALEFAARALLADAAARERALHARFAADRLHNDWFAHSSALEAEIAALQITAQAA